MRLFSCVINGEVVQKNLDQQTIQVLQDQGYRPPCYIIDRAILEDICEPEQEAELPEADLEFLRKWLDSTPELDLEFDC